MRRAPLVYFGLVSLYLLAVVVQFFLAGLGAFGATNYDAHSALGFALGIASLALLVLALATRMPVGALLGTALLFALNVAQFLLAAADDDVDELAALHAVNALAIAFVAHALVQRSRRDYRAAKTAA